MLTTLRNTSKNVILKFVLGTLLTVLIISFAMLIGYFVTKSDGITVDFRNFNVESIPEWSVLVIIPFLMTLVSFIGIHPVISSTILLTIFTSSFFNIEPYLIMQAHLIGWCTGTLCSMASLSVITCSNLFKVPSHKVAFGVNVYVVLGFSLLGGAQLSVEALNHANSLCTTVVQSKILQNHYALKLSV